MGKRGRGVSYSRDIPASLVMGWRIKYVELKEDADVGLEVVPLLLPDDVSVVLLLGMAGSKPMQYA
jgi:hypothetical protein